MLNKFTLISNQIKLLVLLSALFAEGAFALQEQCEPPRKLSHLDESALSQEERTEVISNYGSLWWTYEECRTKRLENHSTIRKVFEDFLNIDDCAPGLYFVFSNWPDRTFSERTLHGISALCLDFRVDRLNIIISKEIGMVESKFGADSDTFNIFNLEQDAWTNYLWQACDIADPAGHSRDRALQNQCISTALIYRATVLAAYVGQNEDFGRIPDDLESILGMQLEGDE